MHEPPKTQKVCEQKDSFECFWKGEHRKRNSLNRIKIQKLELYNDR